MEFELKRILSTVCCCVGGGRNRRQLSTGDGGASTAEIRSQAAKQYGRLDHRKAPTARGKKVVALHKYWPFNCARTLTWGLERKSMVA